MADQADQHAESVACRRRRYDRLVSNVGILGALVVSLAGHPENGLLIMLVTYWGSRRTDG